MRKYTLHLNILVFQALCVFAWTFFLISCDFKLRDRGRNIDNKAVEDRNLTAKRLYVPDMLFPMDLSVSDQHGWIFITERQSPKWVSIFDFEGNLIDRFADEGEGAAEQLSSQKLQWDEENSEVMLFDFL